MNIANRKTNGNGAGQVTRMGLATSQVTRMGPATSVIYGTSIAHIALDKRQLAVIAANVLDGLAWYVPTQQQLAMCLPVCTSYIEVAKGLSWAKRAAILEGRDPTSFADLLLLRRLSAATNISAVPDQALIAMATSIGSAERWLAAGTAAGLR